MIPRIEKKPDDKDTINIENINEIAKKSILLITDKQEQPPEIIKINNSVIGTLGNFSCTTGAAKAKKTFNVSAICSAALSNKNILGYSVILPENKRRILYFDTEQSKYHFHKVIKRIVKLACFPDNEHPVNLITYCLRGNGPEMMTKIIENQINKYDDVGLVFIDGVRDLIFDINNAHESTEIITKLMQLTQEKLIHIHCVLHINKTDGNSRGHLGTELNNKSETVLMVTKDKNDKDISTVESVFMRDKDFEPFAFSIDENGLPYLLDDYKPETNKKYSVIPSEIPNKTHYNELIKPIFADYESGLGYNDLVNKFKEYYSISYKQIGTNKAKNFITYWRENDLIFQMKNKNYFINSSLNQFSLV
jgi:hypothetical protein